MRVEDKESGLVCQGDFDLGRVWTGLISAYSSSSGVVMPMFLPLVPGLAKAVPGAHEDKQRLFKKLLAWGLSLSIIGALACLLFFGILGW